MSELRKSDGVAGWEFEVLRYSGRILGWWSIEGVTIGITAYALLYWFMYYDYYFFSSLWKGGSHWEGILDSILRCKRIVENYNDALACKQPFSQ